MTWRGRAWRLSVEGPGELAVSVAIEGEWRRVVAVELDGREAPKRQRLVPRGALETAEAGYLAARCGRVVAWWGHVHDLERRALREWMELADIRLARPEG